MAARYDFKTPRLFVDVLLALNTRFKADRAQSNYLLNVLRLKDGDEVLLFNGRDGEWRTKINKEGRKSCLFEPVEQTRPQPAPLDLVYLFAPLKLARQDYMVQKSIEMGAGEIQPVITEYTQNSKINLERLKTNIVEAAQQCGILSIASIRPPVKLGNLLQDWEQNRHIIYADEAAPLGGASAGISQLKGNKIAVLVGPEGGFSEIEREILRGLDFVHPISLGPRILRADTAAVAALTIVQSCIGDW